MSKTKSITDIIERAITRHGRKAKEAVAAGRPADAVEYQAKVAACEEIIEAARFAGMMSRLPASDCMHDFSRDKMLGNHFRCWRCGVVK